MPKKSGFKTFYALSLAWQLGFLIAVPIGGFMFVGYLGDRFLKTQPLLLLAGLFVGIFVTIYEVYHMLTPLIEKDSQKEKDA